MRTEGHLFADIKIIGEKSHDGVFIFDLISSNFIYTNHIFAEIFQFSGSDVLIDAKAILACILTEDHHYLQSRLQELVSAGSINTTELKIRVNNNVERHLSCDVFLLDINTIVGFIKDITHEKEHESYLVEITAQKDAFLDMITHNLSGPLFLSQNLLTWVQRSINTQTSNVDSLIAMLQESTQECIDIVNDFLKDEHKESQGIFVNKTRFSVVDKIKTVLDKLQEFSPEKKLTLVVNAADNNINTDSVKFFQIVHNLISNAIKFTHPGGSITVTIDEKDNYYVFSVADNGIGIPENLKPHIFSKKGIAGRDGLKGEKSHGIGLSVIKRLVELIGGELWFESEENKGSVFYFKLPKE